MSYHIVSIDSPNCSISCKKGQLVCKTPRFAEKQLPLEDVAAIVITSFSANLHSHLLLEAAKHGVSLILCEKFKPVSVLLPANRSSDTLLTKASLLLSKKVQGNLWRKTIDAKCNNQFMVAKHFSSKHPKLQNLEKTACSKIEHKESTCARYFWSIFADCVDDPDFKRRTGDGGVNDLLNFGYAILLSLVLQKLMAVGLDPTFGISHEIRERSTPLAYDIMEPFRPAIDARVIRWVNEETEKGDFRLTGRFRKFVSECTIEKVGYFDLELTLENCIESVVRSFRKAILAQQARPYKPWTIKNLKWDG